MPRQTWLEIIGLAQSNGTAIANTTTEAIIVPTAAIPANYMQGDRVLRLTLVGKISATGTPTITFALRWGGVAGTILAQSAAITLAAATDAMFRIEMEIVTRASGSSGSLMATGMVYWGPTIKTTSTPDPMGSAGATNPAPVTPVDLTIDAALALTADWSVANASNTLTGVQMIVESLN